MLKTLTFDDTISRLQQKVARRGINYSLDRLNAALATLGNPHLSLPTTVHIAGTNGKGSVAHYTTQALMNEGQTVLTYTSPHIQCYTERFMVNGSPIAPSDFVHLFTAIEAADATDELSEYEALTLMAFAWANQTPCDVLVLETGLGGRLDATNVVPNSLAIITDIGLDHTNILGPTIRDITTEKAGIIKPNGTIVTHLDHPTDVLEIIKDHAKQNQATVHWAPPKPGFNERNKALAAVALDELIPEPSQPFTHQLNAISPPFGRLSTVVFNDVICRVDVGHNLAAATAILASNPPISDWVIGMQKHKDYDAVIRYLLANNQSVKLCSFDDKLSATVDDLAADLQHLPLWQPQTPTKENTLFFGSFYFIDYLFKGGSHAINQNLGVVHQQST